MKKRNPVAKYMDRVSRRTTFVVRKTRLKAGYIKHKQRYQGDAKGAGFSFFNIILAA